MSLDASGLGSVTIDKLRGVFARYPGIDRVLLYGSRALGTFRPGSDIDLCIFSSTLTLAQVLVIETELDDLLLPQKIDLCLYDHIEEPALREHIMRVGHDLLA